MWPCKTDFSREKNLITHLAAMSQPELDWVVVEFEAGSSVWVSHALRFSSLDVNKAT
jgi:hypothetical protein